jgi:hypothetical protein
MIPFLLFVPVIAISQYSTKISIKEGISLDSFLQIQYIHGHQVDQEEKSVTTGVGFKEQGC